MELERGQRKEFLSTTTGMNPKSPFRHTFNHCLLGTPYQVEAGKPHLSGTIAINHTQTYGTPRYGGSTDNP